MNNLDAITEKIINDAKKEAGETIAIAENKASEIKKEYSAKSEKIFNDMKTEADKEAEILVSRAQAEAKTAKRNAILYSKSRAIDRAFDEAVKSIVSLPEKEYTDFMKKMLLGVLKEQVESEKRAIEEDTEGEIVPCDEYVICLSDKDRSICGDELLKEGNAFLSKYSKKMVMSEKDEKTGGGFIIVCGDIRLDSTVPSLIGSLRASLESEVLSALFD